MDPKRKKLYIIIIVVCVVLAAGILFWDKLGKSTPAAQPTDSSSLATPAASNPGSLVKNADGTYPAPPSFPANPKFDTSVLDSSAFKALYPYLPVTLGTGELGRDDPFKAY